jgi:hypothetical protein
LLSINYLYHRKEECANSPSPLKREVPLALNLWIGMMRKICLSK